MRLWKAIVLVNLALAVGVGLGYLRWAREVRELRAALVQARAVVAARPAGDRTWQVRGIVRVVAASSGAVFLTHEAIPGLMQAMTMGFEVSDPALTRGLQPGDPVRFTLREQGDRVFIAAIEKVPSP
jgi:Cu/Ag efflux protein CusF